MVRTIAYTAWTVDNLERQLSDGLVTVIHWRATRVDGEYSATTYGSINVERGDAFVPFEQLTKIQVNQWVQAAVGKETVEAALLAQVETQKNPVQASGLPW